jgi:peroxiredoxin
MKVANLLRAGATALVISGFLTVGAPALGSAEAAAADMVVPMPSKVADFRLMDETGRPHQLYALKDAKAVVIVTQGVGCPISRNVNPTLIALQKAYADKGVAFFMLNSNLHDTPEAVAEEAKEFGFTVPVLMDRDQRVGEQLGVTRTATAYVIDPKSWKIVYRGPLDDRVTYERQKLAASEQWARDALDVVLTGQGKVAKADRPPEGCLINFERRVASQAGHVAGH